jgi:hypothetical protein
MRKTFPVLTIFGLLSLCFFVQVKVSILSSELHRDVIKLTDIDNMHSAAITNLSEAINNLSYRTMDGQVEVTNPRVKPTLRQGTSKKTETKSESYSPGIVSDSWTTTTSGPLSFYGGTPAISLSPSLSQCDSYRMIDQSEWKPIKDAPHDGTTVEIVETYGVAPWYGLYKWTKDAVATDLSTGKTSHFQMENPSWRSVDTPGGGVSADDGCLFWRPYKGGITYTDPTGGAQKSVAYWCTAMHAEYDAKKDACK